jgi:hypothetical protein
MEILGYLCTRWYESDHVPPDLVSGIDIGHSGAAKGSCDVRGLSILLHTPFIS